jgi:hypothetical protein
MKKTLLGLLRITQDFTTSAWVWVIIGRFQMVDAQV